MGTFMQNLRPLHGLFICPRYKSLMRCDLHVHSIASGNSDTPGLSRVCRESYNDPETVYSRLKRLDMSLVTITDHDSIDAAEALRGYPDFFLSEEVTVTLPSGTQMHLGVYGITERDHTEIQRRRRDFVSLLMYLTERKLFFCANHIFSGLTGRREVKDFQWFASYIPAYETRNGHMIPAQNAAAERFAAQHGKIAVGGSDSHTLAHLGTTYTEVRGARSTAEFLAGLRAGHGNVCGAQGSYFKLTADVYRIGRAMFGEKPATLLLLPLAVLVPAFTMGHWLSEIRFCRRWRAALAEGEAPSRIVRDINTEWEANWAS